MLIYLCLLFSSFFLKECIFIPKQSVKKKNAWNSDVRSQARAKPYVSDVPHISSGMIFYARRDVSIIEKVVEFEFDCHTSSVSSDKACD